MCELGFACATESVWRSQDDFWGHFSSSIWVAGLKLSILGPGTKALPLEPSCQSVRLCVSVGACRGHKKVSGPWKLVTGVASLLSWAWGAEFIFSIRQARGLNC